MRKIALIIALLLSVGLYAQKGVEVARERNFSGNGLYGFMNGGSDLFFEYNFKNLNIREIGFKGHKYTFEIYKMASSEDAFGIYSLHVFKPTRVDALLNLKDAKGNTQLFGFDCLSKYQLQAAFLDEYISIVFNDGESARAGAEELLVEYVKSRIDEIPSPSADNSFPDFTLINNIDLVAEASISSDNCCVPDFIPDRIEALPKPYSGKVKFIRGELGLSSANFDAAKFPQLGKDYTLWSYTSQQGDTKYIEEAL